MSSRSNKTDYHVFKKPVKGRTGTRYNGLARGVRTGPMRKIIGLWGDLKLEVLGR
jgi:hypothetical protein